ncbi:peptidase M14 [Leptolyngbya sp. BL0902]|uniref:M14 family metallopeptidase n=1 Tax=Leptolyngbya sp. BL0902 TaxID=1115757 RepID=UPI0018E8D3CB|nr:succinylglutamate desuccinylase/aspartoacylase family protein [Leptolyngbya sp. BL0902]QQE66234.1 peptidase M14 [Leptolyngbya sp. BL0902]
MTSTFPLSPPSFQTQYTNDQIQGIAVVSQLAVADLEPSRTHRFYFQGVQMGTGQHWYVPVMVAKGNRPGPCVGLVAGVHGDEVSSFRAVQRIMAQLDPSTMAGSVLATLGVSRPAVEYTQSWWPTAQGGGTSYDPNRLWPGDEQGDTAPSRHAGLLWNRLFRPNVDLAMDYHTVTTGSDFTLFLYADLRQPAVRQMAELFPVDQVMDDPGIDGTLETAFVTAGIPAMTVEIGPPRRFDADKIDRAVEGSLNVLKHHGVIPGPLGRTAADRGAVFGNAMASIRATQGGFLELLVDLNAPVTQEQRVALQLNAFGDVVAEYHSPVAGVVAIVARDALCEPGSRVMQILYRQD